MRFERTVDLLVYHAAKE
jgi:hypothetical protein